MIRRKFTRARSVKPVRIRRSRRGAAVLLCTLAAAVASLATVAILRAGVHQHRRSESLRSVATAEWATRGLEARADAVLVALNASGTTDPNDMANEFVSVFRNQYRNAQARVVLDAGGNPTLHVYLERSSRIPELIRPIPQGP